MKSLGCTLRTSEFGQRRIFQLWPKKGVAFNIRLVINLGHMSELTIELSDEVVVSLSVPLKVYRFGSNDVSVSVSIVSISVIIRH